MHNLIEHPGNTQIPHGLLIPDVPKLNCDAWSFVFSQALFKTQSVYAPRSSGTHKLHSWNTHHSDHGTQNLESYSQSTQTWIALRSLSIWHQSDSSQDLVLSTSDSWHTHDQQNHILVLSTECNNKTQTVLFLAWSSFTANMESVNIYKNIKCTDSWGPSS